MSGCIDARLLKGRRGVDHYVPMIPARRRLPVLLLLAATLAAGIAAGRWWPGGCDEGPPARLAYGTDPRQQIDLWPAAGAAPRPLMLWVHGGGWDAGDRASGGGTKPVAARAAGWSWGSLGYRLVPDARVEEQLGDIAAAVARLRAEARRLGIDADRIVLAGHSSGAHLLAMLGTDPRWLARAGVPTSAIAGVVLIDPAALDVAALMRSAFPGTFPHHDRAFGADADRQRRLSPMAAAGGGDDLPRWLILPDAGSGASVMQAAAFARRLRAGGAGVAVRPVAGSDHGRLEAELGRPGDPVAAAVLRWAAE